MSRSLGVPLEVGGWFSFPGSAWERTVCEALPRVLSNRQAEPARQCVPRQSLGTRKPGNEELFRSGGENCDRLAMKNSCPLSSAGVKEHPALHNPRSNIREAFFPPIGAVRGFRRGRPAGRRRGD